MSSEQAIQVVNNAADFLMNTIGVNAIPIDIEDRSEYSDRAVPPDIYKYWKDEKTFSKGINIIGKVFHREDKKDLYLTLIHVKKQERMSEILSSPELPESIANKLN